MADPSDKAVRARDGLAGQPTERLHPEGRRAVVERRTFAPGEVMAGRYRVRRFIAKGGMGEVYEAEDLELHQRVAIKTIHPELRAQAGMLERFRREIRLARQVTHANVCRVFDIEHPEGGAAEALPFLTMELLDGETLSAYLERSGPLDPAEVLELARQMADALHAAHEAGVTHRDFKPGNVMLVPSPRGLRAVVTDFGIAHVGVGVGDRDGEGPLTGRGVMVGTPAYMAPEQAAGGAVTGAADIYSFGVVLHEMLTGERPSAGSALSLLAKRRREPARSRAGGLSPSWETVILRCLSPAPADRFRDARDAIAALEHAVVPAASSTPSSRRSRRWKILASALLLLALGLAVGSLGLRAGRTAAPRRSIAVLGFKNLSNHGEGAWLSDAFAELLGTELVAGEVLRIVPGENVARAKLELGLSNLDTYARETLGRLRSNLGAELVLVGSYVALGPSGSGKIRVDLRIQDTATGELVAHISEEGTDGDVLDLVSRVGARLRERLGVATLSETAAGGLAAARPRNAEAARLYADGLAKLRLEEALAARALLVQAVTADPDFPLAHAALSEAWTAQGYDGRALDEARLAFEHSGSLARQERLAIEGRYRWAMKDWPRAIEVYRTLRSLFPDDPEHGLWLAEVQTLAGRGHDALLTIASLREDFSSARRDPRVALAEAKAAASLSDFRRQLQAASQAVTESEAIGARLLAGQARLVEWWAYRNLSQLDRAVASAREARRIFTEAGHRLGIARALNSLATVLADVGDLEAAYAMDMEALGVFREVGDEKRVSWALSNLGRALRARGQLAEAQARYSDSAAICREIGDKSGLARALGNAGLVHFELGQLPQARAALEESLALRTEIDERRGVAASNVNLALVLWREGRLAEAGALLSEAREQVLRLGDRMSASHIMAFLADVRLDEGRLAEAREEHERALAIRQELGLRRSVLESRLALAELTVREGKPAEAERMARELLAAGGDSTLAIDRARAEIVVALAARAHGDDAAATDAATRALALADPSEVVARRLLVQIAAARVRAAGAPRADVAGLLSSLHELKVQASRLGMPGIAFEARLAWGEVERGRGDAATGRAELLALSAEASGRGFQLIARQAARFSE